MTTRSYARTDQPTVYTGRIVPLAEALYLMSSIRALKAEGKAIKLPNYSRMNKATLVTRLTAAACWQEETHEL